MFPREFESFCLGMLFELDINWEYVRETQFGNFYLCIPNYRASDNNSKTQKKMHEIIGKEMQR